MTEEIYRDILNKIRSYAEGPQIVDYAMRTITHAAIVGYVAMLGVFLLNKQYHALYENILVTGVAFAVVSFLRKKIGAKRPYETMKFEPIADRKGGGDSFPSRHVFSIFIISVAMLKQNIWLGLLFLVMGLFLAVLRVIAGLHYPRDVIAGALIGIISGGLGFFLIFPGRM